MSGSLDSALLLASAPWSLRANRLTLYGRAAVFGQCTHRKSGHLIYHSDGGGYEREGEVLLIILQGSQMATGSLPYKQGHVVTLCHRSR